jgi:hypothetical protein
MNTEVTNLETNKHNTLRTLFNVICADNEFSLLRRTLELYCEEIMASDDIRSEIGQSLA